MKKTLLLLLFCAGCVLMNAQTYLMQDTCHSQTSTHKVWFTIEDLGDRSFQLAFWADSVGGMRSYTVGGSYLMDNYGSSEQVPWRNYSANIRSILNISNVDHIGSFAFSNMPNLRYFSMTDDVVTIGDSAFLGSTNLKTLEWRLGQKIPRVGQGVFMTDRIVDADYPNGKEQWINVLVVPDADYIDTLAMTDELWDAVKRNCRIASACATVNDATYILGESDSISQGLQLSIENWDGSKIIQLADKGADPMPWDAIGDQIEDLVINDNISYVGWGVFASLTNLKSIQFRQRNHPIDSMSMSAFPNTITPWKFALGDPQDGPIVPPVLKDVAGTVFHFRDSTVLYVPDSTFMYEGQMVRSIDLYNSNTNWKRLFNKITDRTVDATTTADNKIELKWYPLELSEGYRLTIRDTQTDKDTTIVIPAMGLRGLIDWASMTGVAPSYLAARRAPKDGDGNGGLVLVIEIEANSGDQHNEPAVVAVSGQDMQDGGQFEYIREVLKKSGVDTSLTKKGTFTAPEKTTAIDSTPYTLHRTLIYDLFGRVVGTQIDALPQGLYIVDQDGARTTILLRR